MTSGSSTAAIAIGQVKKHNWEVATVWIDPQSEKGKISLSLQSRIQSSPESRYESRFYHFPFPYYIIIIVSIFGGVAGVSDPHVTTSPTPSSMMAAAVLRAC